ncbi:MAG: hypothetical protein MRY83_22350 [Flavobacteriales bacterium]|nr:hypothetical protein [Flavobacteriales bacterium]
MKKYSILLLLFMAVSTFNFRPLVRTINLYEGETVSLELKENLTSGIAKVGDIVDLEVTEDVVINGVTVIERGTAAKGTVTQSQRAKIAGQKGKLDFTINYVKAVNGRNIRLSASQSAAGKDHTVGVIAAAAIVAVPLIFIKGKDITMEKGKEFTVFVAKDYELNL